MNVTHTLIRFVLLGCVVIAQTGFAASDCAAYEHLSAFATAQSSATKQASAAEVTTVEFESKLANAKLPYIVVLPAGYAVSGSSATRYPVLYLLHGLQGNPRNWLNFDLAKIAARHNFIFVLVEGKNGFYTDSATKLNDKFESYVMRELIPDVDRRFRTQASRNGRGIAGLSMGGFGALKFGVKYPEQFAFAGSMSGAVGAASYARLEDLAPDFRPLLTSIFGAPDAPSRTANDLFRLVREQSTEARSRLPFLYLDCGTEDFLFESNRRFVEMLTETKTAHEYRQLPGGHTRRYWARQLPEVVNAAARTLATTAAAGAVGSRP